MTRRAVASFLVMVALVLAGCSQHPQAKPANRKLITMLRTAVSAQNLEWLEDAENAIEERRNEGEMADDEYTSFQSIIALAKNGDWKQAERECFAFQEAQRPTQEELDRLPKRNR